MIKKILTYLVMPAIIVVLLYLVVASILKPVLFNKELASREEVAIERLKEIRTLQVAYKSTFGVFTASADTLTDFYNNGQITVIRQIGSMDDSLAVAQKKVKRDSIKIFVKDTLFNTNPNFDINNTFRVPITNEAISLDAIVKEVSGIKVPLFEASIPYNTLLGGMDRQLIINLNAEKESMNRYPGLKVGSVTTPNNNAGNWE